MKNHVFLKGSKLDFERRTPYCCSKIGFVGFGSGAMSVCRNDEKSMTNRSHNPWTSIANSMQNPCPKKVCKKHHKTSQSEPTREPKSTTNQEKTRSRNRCEKRGACPEARGGSAGGARAPSLDLNISSSSLLRLLNILTSIRFACWPRFATHMFRSHLRMWIWRAPPYPPTLNKKQESSYLLCIVSEDMV